MLSRIRLVVMACAVAMPFMSGLPARAESMHFTGSFVNNNDVVLIPFTLAEETEDIYLWTDSSRGGVNFNPLLALWERYRLGCAKQTPTC